MVKEKQKENTQTYTYIQNTQTTLKTHVQKLKEK